MIVKRNAFTEDIPALRALWHAAFPADDEDFAEAFLSVVGIKHCFVAARDGQPISMVFGLPVTCGERRLQYIYAAATLPSHRGQGVFGDLLRYALERAKADGCVGSFLHPAEPSLVGYYARFGYRPWTYCERITGVATVGIACELPVSEYIARRAALLPPCAVNWGEMLLSMAGEKAYATDSAIALCDVHGDTLYMKEWFGEGDPAALCAAVGCARYELVRTVEAGEAYTLLLPFTEEELPPPYVGLVLD